MHHFLLVLRQFGASGREFTETSTIEKAKLIFQNSSLLSEGILSPRITMALKHLRNDSSFLDFIGSKFSQPAIITNYFFSSLERIVHENYLPSRDDILNIKCLEFGLKEETIRRSEFSFRFIIPAMNRSGFNKLCYFFEDVDSIIFIVPLSNYDVQLDSPSEKLILRDDMDFFASICNNKWFARCSSIFLILNKFDIFQRKLINSPLKACFPDYKGSDDPREAAKFIQQRFESLDRSNSRKIYSRIMNVLTDVDAIKEVVESVIETTAKKLPKLA